MRLIRARHLITVNGVYMYDVERTGLVSVGPRIVRRHDDDEFVTRPVEWCYPKKTALVRSGKTLNPLFREPRRQTSTQATR